jgi:hypothetical protein
MTTGALCIYCKQPLPVRGEARRDHVIPHALTAGFADNLTVLCVCPECNDYFGKTLEPVFVEDTVLGPLRYERRVKRDTRRAPCPDPRRLFLRFEGKLVHLQPSDDGARYHLRMPTQVGFRVRGNETGPFVYFTLDGLDAAFSEPTLDHRRFHVVGQGQGFEEEAAAALASRGLRPRLDSEYHSILPRGPDGGPASTIDIEHETLIDHTIKRCMAKIGFNYLAYVASRTLGNAQWLQHHDFDTVRAYVRHGEPHAEPGLATGVAFRFRHVTGPEPDGHLAALRWERGIRDIVAAVSLFSAFTWQMQLARSFDGLAWKLQGGHFWDLADRSVKELSAVPRWLLVP